MPKAKKIRCRPKCGQEVAAVPEARGRSRSKQHEVPARQRSRSVDGTPPRRFPKRIRIDHPLSGNPVMQPDAAGSLNVPPEEMGNSWRNYPEQVTTVSGEAFQEMDLDLKSNFQGVFHGLNTAMGRGCAWVDPNFQVTRSKQPHRRQTRSSAQESDHFFKSLVPKDKIPDQDRNIKVEFAGTNTITTNAPGYTETISFGNGLWSRTRNGVTETGRLDEAEGARIAEQTKETIDGIMHHTASRLTGMMGPSGWFGEPSRPRSPKSLVPPPSAVEPLSGRDGYRGLASGPSNNFTQSGNVESYTHSSATGNPEAFSNMEASGNMEATRNTIGSSGVLSDVGATASDTLCNLSGNVYGPSWINLFGAPLISGFQNGHNGSTETKDPSFPSRKISRPKAADMFERYEDVEHPFRRNDWQRK